MPKRCFHSRSSEAPCLFFKITVHSKTAEFVIFFVDDGKIIGATDLLIVLL